MSSFICRWFRVNLISSLRDIVELPKIARKESRTEYAGEYDHSRELKSDSWELLLNTREDLSLEVSEITILPLKLKFTIITLLPFWMNLISYFNSELNRSNFYLIIETCILIFSWYLTSSSFFKLHFLIILHCLNFISTFMYKN